jgi:hypothetical protein
MAKGLLKMLLCLVVLLSFAAAPALAGGVLPPNQWNGSGPFATGLGDRVITALAVSPSGLVVYAGTGSGTVFSYMYDSDGDGIADTSDNCPSVANANQNDANGNGIGDACDPADSDSDGISDEDEVAAGSDPSLPTSVPTLTVTAAPASLANDARSTVTLTLTPVIAGDTLTIEQIVDVDNDGVVDAGEPALRSFAVTDGVAGSNSNVLGDSDGAADGSITVVLNLRDAWDIHHVPGNFLFWASDGSRTGADTFAVTVTLGSQSISGTVTDGTNPVPGALVTLQGEGFAATPYGAFADRNGDYRVEVTVPDDYHVVAEDLTGQWITANADGNALVTVGAGQHLTGINRTLTAGTVTISGNAGTPGVKVMASATAYGAHGQVLANSDGTYQLSVPAGTYGVRVEPTDHLGLHPSSQGLMGQKGSIQEVNAAAGASGIDFTQTPASVNVSGTVRDEFGATLDGIVVGAVNDVVTTLPTALALSDSGGAYTLGLSASDAWTLTVVGRKLWPQDKLSSQISNYDTATSPATGNDLVVYDANAWIVGTVQNALGQPMSRVKVIGWNGDGSLCTGGWTDADGSYRLPARGSMSWTVDALTEEQGKEPVPSQMASLTNGQTATLDFAVPLPTVSLPASITVPASDTDGSYIVSWGTSATGGVTYVLQEATNATFTAGLRQAYSGPALTTTVIGRSSGVTYYYRVRATRANYLVSSWHIAANGCAVSIPCIAPASITVPADSASGSYTVSWGGSPNAVGYVLQEATNATFTAGLRQAYAGTALSTTIVGRSNGMTYYYRVRATRPGYTPSVWTDAANGCLVTIAVSPPASLTVPPASASGNYMVSWETSPDGVGYVLQEATNATFTANLRQAYAGTATSASISGRTTGVTYHYRVRATRPGYTPSDWISAGNGCLIGP